MKVKVKWSRYRPSLAQRVGRGIALLFHDHGTRRWWVVSSTLRPHFAPWKDPVPILQEAGWAPGPVWKGGKSHPHRDSIPDRPARSQSLYQLSYTTHIYIYRPIYYTNTAQAHYNPSRGYDDFSVFFSNVAPCRCRSGQEEILHLLYGLEFQNRFWIGPQQIAYCT